MSIKDIFDDLKRTVVGSTTKKIDDRLNDAIKGISSYKTQSGRNGYIELVKTIISKSAISSSIDLGGITGMSGQGSSPAALGQGDRLRRYKAYESILANINYCNRALNVLRDNILSPDDITKVSLNVIPLSFLEDKDETEAELGHVQQVIKTLKLESYLDMIVKNTLLYGDFFSEIADHKTAITSRSMISETLINYANGEENSIENIITDSGLKASIDYSSFDESKKESGETKLNNISLLYHEPKRVVRLQSSTVPICFGYLVFPYPEISTPYGTIEDEMINSLCLSILQNVEKKIPTLKLDNLKNTDDIKDILRILITTKDSYKSLKVRYVPPDKMVHFKIPSTKFFPYGESIFDSAQFSAKMLIALETALTIQRLSRSTEKRKISVEMGLPRDARKLIEDLKRTFNSRKITLDSFGTVDTIPSMIGTFEDIYIPTKDGKAYVDVAGFTEGNVDVRSKVDELKYVRDSIIAGLQVPPSFIGLEENISNKAALSEESILFARTVVSHQKYFTQQINELIEKVYGIIEPEKSLNILDNVSISLPSPKSLQYEREARYLGELATLVETLERIGIPREYSKKKYLSSIDWDEVKKYEVETNLEKGTNEEEESGGMGGMGGMPTY